MKGKVWKIGCLYVLLSSLAMTSVANAACTPTPDCASIGYTETSCEGDSLKCPFDITKMMCMPCDSSFRYDCAGANVVGVGNTCNGKYASCSCSDAEYTFSNGECIGPKCPVGYIYYSDKSCSADLDNSKTAIGIVVKDDKYIAALNVPDMKWASNTSTDVSGITNITSSEAKTDYNGKANTLAILEAYPSDTTSNNAAIYCNSYSTAGTSAGDWYLPALGEVYDYIYTNYAKVKAGWDKVGTTISDSIFWSSSEYNLNGAWYVISSNGNVNGSNKNNLGSVSCLLAL